MADTHRDGDTAAIAELEALFAEFAQELRDMRDMLMLYRDTVADAARYIAHRLADASILAITDPHGHELASALARMGGISAEVDALLTHTGRGATGHTNLGRIAASKPEESMQRRVRR